MYQKLTTALIAGVFLFGGTPALAGPNTNVAVAVTPQTSTPGQVDATENGANAFYDYELVAGGGIDDTIHVEFCASITQAGDGAGFPFTVAFGPNGGGGNLPGVTKPTDIVFSSAGCQTVAIVISTGALAEDNYSRLVSFAADDTPTRTHVSFDLQAVHIRAKVTGANSTTCFITDSSFEFLLDCAGNQVTSGSDGRFAIVTNKKGIQVATNPGQFYYNILWTNTTGGSRNVKVAFQRYGVQGKGAQAIHAKVFPSFPTIDAATFAAVNDAIPSATDDNLENVLVPAGWTVWVSYHLEWSSIGSVIPPNAGLSCSVANQPFSVVGTVRDYDTNDELGTCTAGASGYRK